MEKRFALNPSYYVEKIVIGIQEFFKDKQGARAVVGISGGKDSTFSAGVCAKAIGPDRVIAVMLPNGEQKDISDSEKVCDFLGIKNRLTVNINSTYEAATNALIESVGDKDIGKRKFYNTNTPARIRMMMLYAIAGDENGFVCNTCNLSEDYVGYSTKYGDSGGDFAVINKFTVSEVRALGMELGLPRELMFKAPSDGMCGMTDEDNMGFTYQELDDWIRYGIKSEHFDKIDRMHKNPNTRYKILPMYNVITDLPDASNVDNWRSR